MYTESKCTKEETKKAETSFDFFVSFIFLIAIQLLTYFQDAVVSHQT